MSSKYPRGSLQSGLAPHELPRSISKIYNISGLDVSLRESVISRKANLITYIAGNAIVEYDIKTKVRKYVFGLDGKGIGCFAMHPGGELIAIGEQGNKPNIYVCEYPSFDIRCICRDGTERGYSSLDFSSDGESLASVGQVSSGDIDYDKRKKS